MESMVVFWLLMVFLFGGMTFGLYFGYRSTEERRALEQETRDAREALSEERLATLPSFFVQGESDRPSSDGGFVFDDALLANVESYVKSEQKLAKKFVNDPSVDALYYQPSVSRIVH